MAGPPCICHAQQWPTPPSQAIFERIHPCSQAETSPESYTHENSLMLIPKLTVTGILSPFGWTPPTYVRAAKRLRLNKHSLSSLRHWELNKQYLEENRSSHLFLGCVLCPVFSPYRNPPPSILLLFPFNPCLPFKSPYLFTILFFVQTSPPWLSHHKSLLLKLP
jgi:hypothetical protein